MDKFDTAVYTLLLRVSELIAKGKGVFDIASYWRRGDVTFSTNIVQLILRLEERIVNGVVLLRRRRGGGAIHGTVKDVQ